MLVVAGRLDLYTIPSSTCIACLHRVATWVVPYVLWAARLSVARSMWGRNSERRKTHSTCTWRSCWWPCRSPLISFPRFAPCLKTAAIWPTSRQILPVVFSCSVLLGRSRLVPLLRNLSLPVGSVSEKCSECQGKHIYWWLLWFHSLAPFLYNEWQVRLPQLYTGTLTVFCHLSRPLVDAEADLGRVRTGWRNGKSRFRLVDAPGGKLKFWDDLSARWCLRFGHG